MQAPEEGIGTSASRGACTSAPAASVAVGAELFASLFGKVELARGRTGADRSAVGDVPGRRIRPDAITVRNPARSLELVTAQAPSSQDAIEITHAALAAYVAQCRGENWSAFPFQVEATREGVLQRWTGLEWVTVLAGRAVVAPGDRIQWIPEATTCVPSSFVVRGLGAMSAHGMQAAADPVFLVAVDPDGRAGNVLATADAHEQAHVATALLQSKEELRRLSNLLVSIQEDERRRIALDLHDGLGQSLSLIKLSIENSARLLAAGASSEAGAALLELLPRVKDALADVRRVSTELRPVILDDLGILPALSWFVRELEAVACGVRVESTLAVSEHQVPARLHITIFRIVQEALHNVIKHAGATRVGLRMERTGRMLHLLIEDDGQGFDAAGACSDPSGRRGLGLLSMRERAYVTGGSYMLRSAQGQGTCIWVSWPCDVPA